MHVCLNFKSGSLYDVSSFLFTIFVSTKTLLESIIMLPKIALRFITISEKIQLIRKRESHCILDAITLSLNYQEENSKCSFRQDCFC